MNKLFKIFLASVLALTMCVPIASLASGEVNLCGSYAQIAEGGSILSYTDGSFSGEGTFTNDSVSSGFCSVKVGSGGEVTSTTGSVLTYPTGVGGRAADDRSVKL
ncbi:MAG: hypothetical protein IKB93_04290, partial [Clostridia bacterium]|nr:hypothetical protein [Clostridia bacterium]